LNPSPNPTPKPRRDCGTGSGLSLADRLCLALAARLDATAWTADTAWQGLSGVRLIR
jgi:PIN domain nuclease of toxin-antitoxin system